MDEKNATMYCVAIVTSTFGRSHPKEVNTPPTDSTVDEPKSPNR